jgi:hypothetical protein
MDALVDFASFFVGHALEIDAGSFSFARRRATPRPRE